MQSEQLLVFEEIVSGVARLKQLAVLKTLFLQKTNQLVGLKIQSLK